MTTTDKINRVLAGLRISLALAGLAIALLAVIALVWVMVSRPSVPKFRMVAEHGSVLSIVVDEKVAADDAALLQIADSLVPRFRLPMLVLHVWTDARMVPYEIADMTAAQLAARRAMVEIDVNRDVRKVERRVK
jgi:hypothetical protein